MAKAEGRKTRTTMTVAEALLRAEMIDRALDNWERTAPGTIAQFGGRDALARASEMTCIGPMPRLPQDIWERACLEHVRSGSERGR